MYLHFLCTCMFALLTMRKIRIQLNICINDTYFHPVDRCLLDYKEKSLLT